MTNSCPNCKNELIDDKQIICLKCGKRLQGINPAPLKDKTVNINVPQSKSEDKPISFRKKNFLLMVFLNILAFIFLSFTILSSYFYIFNQNMIMAFLKKYSAPYSINLFCNLINFSRDAALNKDKHIYNFYINQMKLENKFLSDNFNNLYPLEFKVLKNEINIDDKKIKIVFNVKNSSPVEIELKNDHFYLVSQKGLCFSDSKNEENSIYIKPWGNKDLILYFKNVILTKNNFLKAKIVFNNSKNYAINDLNLIFKENF